MTVVQQSGSPPAPVQGALPVPAAPRPPAKPRNVPRRVRSITGTALAVLALLFGLLSLGGSSAGEGLRVIGHDAGPQVIATAGLYLGLSDMDAQVADILLMGSEYGERRDKAQIRYDQRRAEANQALLQAFELTGDDQAERRTIQSVLDGLGRYERLAGRALLLNTQSAHAPGPPPKAVLEEYRKATDLMRLELLPKAFNLTLESGTIVRRVHDEELASVNLLSFGLIFTVLGALVVLGFLQIYLARAFRRRLAPALLAATAVVAVYGIYGVSVLQREVVAISDAKRDGFDSVLAMARARAIGNSLHADQARYLLDPERADTYEHAFLDKSQALVYTEGGNVEAYHAGLAKGGAIKLGLLGTVNSKERGALEELITSYRSFQRTDGEMRALAASGKTADAVSAKLGALGTGFAEFDGKLVATAERHEKLFTRAVGVGDDALNGLWGLLPYIIGGTAVLVAAGVWPRLREYR